MKDKEIHNNPVIKRPIAGTNKYYIDMSICVILKNGKITIKEEKNMTALLQLLAPLLFLAVVAGILIRNQVGSAVDLDAPGPDDDLLLNPGYSSIPGNIHHDTH